MKTLNKILLVVAIVIVSIVSAKAQYLAEQPSTGFQSTSAMVGSGSTIQTGGEFISADAYYDNATGGHHGAARKAGGGSTGGGPGGGDREDPFQDPIGDGMWVLMAMAAGAALLRRRRKASGIVH